MYEMRLCTRPSLLLALLVLVAQQPRSQAFLAQPQAHPPHAPHYHNKQPLLRRAVEYNDFGDFETKDDASSSSSELKVSDILQSRQGGGRRQDLSACRVRQLSLGRDFVLDSFIGTMGFDEVTDWEYYYENEDDSNDRRKVVNPNPFHKATPRRTRTKSGSVVRLFRGELVGTLGGMISAQGYDRRVLVKEYTGDMALELARNELASIAKLQSTVVAKEASAAQPKDGGWYRAASSRSVMEREDNNHVARLLLLLQEAPFVGILGECNLAELDDMDPNEFYRYDF